MTLPVCASFVVATALRLADSGSAGTRRMLPYHADAGRREAPCPGRTRGRPDPVTPAVRRKADVQGLPYYDPRLRLPIPQREIDTNPNLVQNEGY